MTTQLIIRIDSEIKNKAAKIAQSEGRNISQVVRDLLEKYIQERDMNAYIDDLWMRTGRKLKDKDVDSKSIKKIIKAVRNE